MGKALLVNAITETLGNGLWILPGSYSRDNVENNMKLRATRDMTFSNLSARVGAGNSGQCTLVSKEDGVVANQTITMVGLAANEDVANTDVLTAGQDIGFQHTDTGTDVTYDAITMNVAFTNGHGSIHVASAQASGFIVADAASATRFAPVSGALETDLAATEADVQVRNNAYTSWEALVVVIDSNARTNTSTFTNRIDGANGSASISVATLLTGTFQDTSVGDALVPGTSLLSTAVALLTGVEDLGVSSIQSTFLSTDLKSQLITGSTSAGVTRAASATPTYYMFGGALSLSSATEATRRVKPGFTARCGSLGIDLSANTYAGASTIKLFIDGVEAISKTINAAATGLVIEEALTADISPTSEISAEVVGGTSGSITIKEITLNLGPTTSLRANPMLLLGVGRGIPFLVSSFLLWDEGRIGDISMHGYLDLDVIYEASMIAPGDNQQSPPNSAFLNAFFLELRDGDGGSNPGIGNVHIVLDYEAWLMVSDINSPTGVNQTMVQRYVTLINIAKQYFTQVSLYDSCPERASIYLNFPPGHPTFELRRNNWMSRCALMTALWNVITAVWPSLYYIAPVHQNEDDRDMWYEDNLLICQTNAPGKKVYPFLWPRIHNSVDPAMPYISGPYWRSSLEKLRALGYDGYALWLFSGDVDPRTLTPVPAWWLETVDFSTTV